MSMFPGANARIYTNEAGEVLGWDYPSDEPYDPYDDPEGGNPPYYADFDDDDYSDEVPEEEEVEDDDQAEDQGSEALPERHP